MIDVGLIGFGLAGRTFHAPTLSCVPGLRLAAILQRRGDEASKMYPGVRVVRSLEELLAMEQIRLAIVATPNASHFELARRCLEAGRNVIIDKPFATTYREAAELAELAQRAGLLLSVYHNRRWDGDFMTVQQLASAETLGHIALYESHFDRFRPAPRPNAWRERAERGSGALFDLGPHLIDQALLLFGVPEAVSADVRIERQGAVIDDAFDVTLYYPGRRAVLRASMLACAPGPRFLIHGARGSYVKYGLDPQEAALRRGEKPDQAHWGEEAEESWGTLSVLEGDAVRSRQIPTAAGDYRRFYENVRDAIAGTAALGVTLQQALRVMRVLELAQESSRNGCALPWPSSA